MVKKLLLLLTILSFLILPSIAYAQTSISTDSAASRLKEQMKTLKDQKQEALKIKREELKAKLQTIRDQKKKALVERIDTKLSKANTKHTDRFAQVLSNLQTVLDKIGEDVGKTIAQAAIDAAKLAVENQAAKTYTITISTETALRLDVGTVTSQLRQDLSSTHKLVVDAKQAVQTLKKDSAIMKKGSTNAANL